MSEGRIAVCLKASCRVCRKGCRKGSYQYFSRARRRMCVSVCECVEVWRHEREQAMRGVEHARAQALASLRASLTPQLPEKYKNRAQGKEMAVVRAHTSTFQGLAGVCVEGS